MVSSNPLIKYILITPENALEATRVEMEIFPGMCAYFNYAKNKNYSSYTVNLNGQIIGVTGLYVDERLNEPLTAWLGWYGLLPPFRGCGLGKTVLSDTVAEAKRLGYETLRLYTSQTLCSAACGLYDAVMDFGEDYTLEELPLKRRVYTKSLCDKSAARWNGRYLYLKENREEELAAEREYRLISAGQGG